MKIKGYWYCGLCNKPLDEPGKSERPEKAGRKKQSERS